MSIPFTRTKCTDFRSWNIKNININMHSMLSPLANWTMVPFLVVSPHLLFKNYFCLPFLSTFLGASSKLFGMCLRNTKLIKSNAKLILSLLLEMPSCLHVTASWLKTRLKHDLLHEVSPTLSFNDISHPLPWTVIVLPVCKHGHKQVLLSLCTYVAPPTRRCNLFFLLLNPG